MHTIDLGDEVKFTVKYKGKEYVLREPTVRELDGIKDDKVDFAQMLSALGMPSDVLGGMGISKARQILDGMIELVTKKK